MARKTVDRPHALKLSSSEARELHLALLHWETFRRHTLTDLGVSTTGHPDVLKVKNLKDRVLRLYVLGKEKVVIA